MEAPEAASVIRATLAKELGEKSPELLSSGGGKEPTETASSAKEGKSPVGKEPVGKQPVPVAETPAATDEWDEYSYPGVGVNGIYFSSIARGSGNFEPKSPPPGDHPPTTKKKPPHRPNIPPTEPPVVVPPPISKTSPE